MQEELNNLKTTLRDLQNRVLQREAELRELRLTQKIEAELNNSKSGLEKTLCWLEEKLGLQQGSPDRSESEVLKQLCVVVIKALVFLCVAFVVTRFAAVMIYLMMVIPFIRG